MEFLRAQRIASVALTRGVKPLAPKVAEDSDELAIVGFDTEYTSANQRLLLFQLWSEGKGKVYTPPLSVKRLVAEVDELVGRKPKRIVLVTYFSLAELQFLPVFADGKRFFVGGRGSLDVRFELGKRVLEVFDLARWYDGQSLASAAKAHGMRKRDWNTRNVTARDARKAAFREYALHDARLCHDLLVQLRGAFHAEGVEMLEAKTPAGASARVFRTSYLRVEVDAPPPRARFLALLGTWGGRTEVYRRGAISEGVEFDLPSAYPNAAAAFGVLPSGRHWRAVGSLRRIDDARGGFARVAFAFPPCERYPCLPVVAEGYQLFPLEGTSYATFAEVQYARELGAKLELIEGWGFDDGDDTFPSYLRRLMDDRKGATGARRVALKLLANSVIGKCAQAIEDYGLEDLRRVAAANELTLLELVEMHPEERAELGVKKRLSLGSLFLPEWNGLITGHVRAQLARMLHVGEPIYSATDAVWYAGNPGVLPYPAEKKHEGHAIIARTRLARLGAGHVVHHSVARRSAASRLLSQFVRAGGNDVRRKYRVRRPLKAMEALRFGLPLGKWIEETRTARTDWDGKRKLLPDETTRPWLNLGEFLAWRETRE
jgi:hypothetical protein